MANDTAKRLLVRVKTLREALGLSQEAFAERAGLKYKHYQAIEAGRKLDFKFSTLEKLAKGCGVQLVELVNFEAPPLAAAEDPAGDRFGPAPGKRKGAGKQAVTRKGRGRRAAPLQGRSKG